MPAGHGPPPHGGHQDRAHFAHEDDDRHRLFSAIGRCTVDMDVLEQHLSTDGFNAAAFITAHMGHMNKGGFETVKYELDKLAKHVHTRVLDRAVNSNEIYVLLCESVQSAEPNLQKLHTMLSNLRALLGQLRVLVTSDAVLAADGHSQSRGDPYDSHSAQPLGDLARSKQHNGEPPELAVVLPVRTHALAAALCNNVASFQFGQRYSSCALQHAVITRPAHVQVWRTYLEHLELAVAEQKLHKVHRLISAAEAVLADVLQQCDDVGQTVALHLWLEQSEFYLEEHRQRAISLLERSIMVRPFFLPTSWAHLLYLNHQQSPHAIFL